MKLLSTALAISLLLCAIQHDMAKTVTQEQSARKLAKVSVPALFAFGDSILDTGNNNMKLTIVKSNFLPYGSNFVTHRPTGRFCDGKIPPDFLASKLGIKETLPAYLGTNLSNQDLITGVSFASGGTGYDPLTPKALSVISMPEQLEMFKEYKEKVKRIVGEQKTAEIISQSLYLIMAGCNDVAVTYFTTPFRKPQYDFSAYANMLVQLASSFFEQLIQLGPRRFAILGLPPVGCIPSQRTLGGRLGRGCASDQNEMVRIFNSRLSNEVEKLRTRHQDPTFFYLNVYDFFYDMNEHPTKYGFENSNKGCCGTGLMEVAILCNPTTLMVCPNISKHVYWDGYHPSERAYNLMADYLYNRYLADVFG